MLLYTLFENTYRDIKYLQTPIREKFYINVTNECPCSCTFCLRQTKKMMEGNTLWIGKSPTADEFITELKKYDLSNVPEIIFCGFGEPTENLDAMLETAFYLKKRNPDIHLRINSNGLGNLIHGRDITPLFNGLIDTISISLNASNKEEYLRLTRSKYGIESFDAMLSFATRCKEYIPNVVLTVVDIIGDEEIAKCQKICDDLGLHLRVRAYEE